MGDLGESVLTLRTDNTELKSGVKEGESLVESWRAKVNLLHDAVELVGFAWEGVGSVVDMMKEWVKEAGEAELAETKLASAIKATGSDADVTQLKEYAGELQKVTRFTDEQVMEGQRLFISFGATGGQVNRLTQAAVNLSSALGIDLQGSSLMLSKAMEGNTVALGRYGIKVDETATDSEKLEQALQQIEQRFGGLAGDEGNTFIGMWDRLTHSLGEVYEALGRSITQSTVLRNLMPAMQTEFLGLAGSIDDNVASLTQWVDQLLVKALSTVQSLIGWLQALAREWGLSTAPLDALSAAIGRLQHEAVGDAGTIIKKFQDVDGTWHYVSEHISGAPVKPTTDTAPATQKFHEFADQIGDLLAQAGLTAGKRMMEKLFSKVVEGWLNIASWVAAAGNNPPEFVLGLMMQGSPKMPYSDYLKGYAPSLLDNFVRAGSGNILQLQTTLGRMIAAATDAWGATLPNPAMPGSQNLAALKTWQQVYSQASPLQLSYGIPGNAAGPSPYGAAGWASYNAYDSNNIQRTADATERLANSWSNPGTGGRMSASQTGSAGIASGSRASWY